MKLSKILYAIVNEILPVPKQILDQFYQKYDQFIQSSLKEQTILIDKKFEITKNEKIAVVFIKSIKSNGKYEHIGNINQFIFWCSNKLIDKDIIQHQLKHMVQFHTEKLIKLQKLQDIQFKTYITDFCNLMTQIYKRLNRRFNISLDTIIQKVVIDVVDNKTNINKYKKLLNGSSEFDCYEKCIIFLQLYKYGKTTIDNRFINDLVKFNINTKEFKSQSKYEQFFKILKQHVKLDVKKQKEYDVDILIKNKDLKQLDNLIQKRVISNNKIEQILNLYIQSNKLDYIVNIKDSYPTLNKNIKNKIEHYLGENL